MNYPCLYSAPFGDITLIFDAEENLVELNLHGCPEYAPYPLPEAWKKKLDDYFSGRLKNFHHPISTQGTAFQQKVWQAIAEIPAGQVMTYQDIARKIGSHPRAVGGACGKNPLAFMARHNAVVQDLQDLGKLPYTYEKALPQEIGNKAIGWLYCAEGSNLGAAFLFKHAQKLDYNGEHGARHLAPHPDGRGKHWREFVEHLNALPLSPEAEAEAIQGAKEAFEFYKTVLRKTFGLPEGAEAPAGFQPHRH